MWQQQPGASPRNESLHGLTGRFWRFTLVHATIETRNEFVFVNQNSKNNKIQDQSISKKRHRSCVAFPVVDFGDAILPESERRTLHCFGLGLGAFLTVDRTESNRSTGWKVLKPSALHVLRSSQSSYLTGGLEYVQNKKDILEDFPVRAHYLTLHVHKSMF